MEARFASNSEQLQFSMGSLSAPIPRAPGDGGERGASRGSILSAILARDAVVEFAENWLGGFLDAED